MTFFTTVMLKNMLRLTFAKRNSACSSPSGVKSPECWLRLPLDADGIQPFCQTCRYAPNPNPRSAIRNCYMLWKNCTFVIRRFKVINTTNAHKHTVEWSSALNVRLSSIEGHPIHGLTKQMMTNYHFELTYQYILKLQLHKGVFPRQSTSPHELLGKFWMKQSLHTASDDFFDSGATDQC